MITSTKEKEQIRKNLAATIDDETDRRIKALHPHLKDCPTCDNKFEYHLDGRNHKCYCDFQILLQKHYFAANIGRAYHTLCLEHLISDDAPLLNTVIERYLNNWKDNFYYGHGLTFTGRVGTGKSLSLAIILKELIKKGCKAYFITFDELVDVFGSAWNNDEAKYLDTKLRSVDILGIDELKTDPRNSNGFLSSAAENIIRYRASNLLPTLVTTNLTPEDIGSIFTKSYSLLSALNETVKPLGGDVRGNIIKERDLNAKVKNERRPVC